MSSWNSTSAIHWHTFSLCFWSWKRCGSQPHVQTGWIHIHGCRNHFESGGHKCTSKNYGKFLRFELKIVTSQALKMTSLNFVSMFKQLYAMFHKLATTPVCTTPALYTDWAHKYN